MKRGDGQVKTDQDIAPHELQNKTVCDPRHCGCKTLCLHCTVVWAECWGTCKNMKGIDDGSDETSRSESGHLIEISEIGKIKEDLL